MRFLLILLPLMGSFAQDKPKEEKAPEAPKPFVMSEGDRCQIKLASLQQAYQDSEIQKSKLETLIAQFREELANTLKNALAVEFAPRKAAICKQAGLPDCEVTMDFRVVPKAASPPAVNH